MFRKLMLGAIAASFLSAPATAADIKGPAYKAPPLAYNWTGWYGGVDAGRIGSRADQVVVAVAPSARVDPDGFVGGVHLGYRWQAPSSHLVYGIEADLWGSNADGEARYPFTANDGILNLNWGSSIRGSVGVAFSPTLLYVTGGVSFINIDGCTTPNLASPGVCSANSQFKDDRVGWTVGVGLAHAFTSGWIARVEYLYADYGDKNYSTPGLIAPITAVDLQTHTIRGGLSWRFSTR